MGTYIKPVTRINHIHATGIHFSLQLFSATIMILSGAFLLTLFVLSGAKVIGKGKGVFREADFSKDVGGKVMGGSVFWLLTSGQTWQAASDECAKHSGKLASLNTQKKIDFVTSEVLDQSKSTWIGATCKDCSSNEDISSDKWFWENGVQLFVTNDMWGKDGGTKYPYDDPGSTDATEGVIAHDDAQGWYLLNHSGIQYDYYGLCELEL